MSYKSVWDFGRDSKADYGVHKIGEYPSKIHPLVFNILVERFSKIGDTILDPFCGSGTVAVEAKLQGRNSINYDINPKAVQLTQEKIDSLTKEEIINSYNELREDSEVELKRLSTLFVDTKYKFKILELKKNIQKINNIIDKIQRGELKFQDTKHIIKVGDARKITIEPNSIDSIITDIPYASMIKYSNLQDDISNIENYSEFVYELENAFKNALTGLKTNGYCVVISADYRIGAAREIFPVHSDLINIMKKMGLTLFDIYIWRYYRSGSFRPFGKRPFQAMNIHSYITVFYKSDGNEINKMNQPIKYRKKLIEKIQKNNHTE